MDQRVCRIHGVMVPHDSHYRPILTPEAFIDAPIRLIECNRVVGRVTHAYTDVHDNICMVGTLDNPIYIEYYELSYGFEYKGPPQEQAYDSRVTFPILSLRDATIKDVHCLLTKKSESVHRPGLCYIKKPNFHKTVLNRELG